MMEKRITFRANAPNDQRFVLITKATDGTLKLLLVLCIWMISAWPGCSRGQPVIGNVSIPLPKAFHAQEVPDVTSVFDIVSESATRSIYLTSAGIIETNMETHVDRCLLKEGDRADDGLVLSSSYTVWRVDPGRGSIYVATPMSFPDIKKESPLTDPFGPGSKLPPVSLEKWCILEVSYLQEKRRIIGKCPTDALPISLAITEAGLVCIEQKGDKRTESILVHWLERPSTTDPGPWSDRINELYGQITRDARLLLKYPKSNAILYSTLRNSRDDFSDSLIKRDIASGDETTLYTLDRQFIRSAYITPDESAILLSVYSYTHASGISDGTIFEAPLGVTPPGISSRKLADLPSGWKCAVIGRTKDTVLVSGRIGILTQTADNTGCLTCDMIPLQINGKPYQRLQTGILSVSIDVGNSEAGIRARGDVY